MSDIDPDNPVNPEIPEEVLQAINKIGEQIREKLRAENPNLDVEFLQVSMGRIHYLTEHSKVLLNEGPQEVRDLMDFHRDHNPEDADIDDPRWEMAGDYMRSVALFWLSQDIQMAAADPETQESIAILEVGPKLMEWVAAFEDPQCPHDLREPMLKMLKDKEVPYKSPEGSVKWTRTYVLHHFDQLPEAAQEFMHSSLVASIGLWLAPERI